ncbi:zinc finger protein 664-like isoform X2 [Periplaneta americana]|uniref:zinc finger protein 664-like isoform X2 n=1 Tax=Periplaneta americana TaxID=6978 RepID=UPI0037E98044
MDAIKTEPDVDPLAVQPCDDAIKEEENTSPDEGNLLDLHVTKIKKEYLDDTYNRTEIKFEEIILPINFPMVKREAEEEQSDLDTVNEERRLEVTAEDNEVFTERIATTTERTISSEFDGISHEENETVCEIPKNSIFSGTPIRIHEDEKQLQFEVSKVCLSNSAKLSRRSRKNVGKKPFKCNACYKCFSESYILKRHERLHTSDKPFKCDVCGMYFSQLGNLKTHERRHTGEKPFKCDVCGKCFSNPSNLKRHERRHTGEKPFKCDVCGMRFSQSSSLKRHEFIHTGEKPFNCSVCGKYFSKSCSLKTHERLHTGEKPFKCDACDLCFSQSSTLRNHKRRHTGEKPFKCDICVSICGEGEALDVEAPKDCESAVAADDDEAESE